MCRALWQSRQMAKLPERTTPWDGTACRVLPQLSQMANLPERSTPWDGAFLFLLALSFPLYFPFFSLGGRAGGVGRGGCAPAPLGLRLVRKTPGAVPRLRTCGARSPSAGLWMAGGRGGGGGLSDSRLIVRIAPGRSFTAAVTEPLQSRLEELEGCGWSATDSCRWRWGVRMPPAFQAQAPPAPAGSGYALSTMLPPLPSHTAHKRRQRRPCQGRRGRSTAAGPRVPFRGAPGDPDQHTSRTQHMALVAGCAAWRFWNFVGIF